MPRYNKITERLFAEMDFKRFLDIDKTMGLEVSPILMEMKELYQNLTQEHATDLKALAALEEIIIQIRAKEVIESELRLSLSKDYIYARSIFFRKGNKMNDIRVLVGKTDKYGDNLDVLLLDPEFRILCKDKLAEAMDEEILRNVNQLKEVYNEKFTN